MTPKPHSRVPLLHGRPSPYQAACCHAQEGQPEDRAPGVSRRRTAARRLTGSTCGTMSRHQGHQEAGRECRSQEPQEDLCKQGNEVLTAAHSCRGTMKRSVASDMAQLVPKGIRIPSSQSVHMSTACTEITVLAFSRAQICWPRPEIEDFLDSMTRGPIKGRKKKECGKQLA